MSLVISKEFADQQSGKVAVASHQNSEQSNRRRELLAVEEESKKNKIIKAHGESFFTDQVMSKFFAHVNVEVNKKFDNKEDLLKKIKFFINNYDELIKIKNNAKKSAINLSIKTEHILDRLLTL